MVYYITYYYIIYNILLLYDIYIIYMVKFNPENQPSLYLINTHVELNLLIN